MTHIEITNRFPRISNLVNARTLAVIHDCMSTNDDFTPNAASSAFSTMEEILTGNEKSLKKLSRVDVCEFSFFCLKLTETQDPIAMMIANDGLKKLNKFLLSQLK
ncbi:hypothetical protein [Photobacterium damselae]|uniref:hypothetical protein n=1 Tax=Photobacterium damselae TaxID=38293 RepID=UPI001F18461E|nr:hypothetical protein [Photobacterium damselae]UKA04795.1 hypothetical protein IHC89_21370 [Photobacterium damselae subsp. damselae]